jgi:hypothetical protein
MVLTEWMKSVKEALKTIPKNTPNRLGAAMKKAKLTYKKKGSSASSDSGSVMKKTFKRRSSHKGRKGRKGKGRKGSRKHHSRRHRGGAMSTLNPAEYDGKGVGTSGADTQLNATNRS